MWVVGTALVSAAMFLGPFLAGWRPLLGLDLRGGLAIVYQPYLPGKHGPVSSSDIDTTINIIRNRIDALGVAQPSVQSEGGNIVVELPGIKNPATAERVIGTTAKLYFRPILCQLPPYSPPKGKAKLPSLSGTPQCPPYTAGTYRPTENGVGSNPPPLSNDPLAALYPNTPLSEIAPDKPVILPLKGFPQVRFLLGPSPLDGTAITSAAATLIQGQWAVVFNLSSRGTAKFNQIAVEQYHKDFAIVLDNQIISMPLMAATSFPGQGQISPLTEPEARDLAIELNYGALPVQLKQLTAQTVTPTLGASSLRAGLAAGIGGLVLVLVYVIFYYRGLGVVAVVGLATTAAFLYGLICILGQTISTTLDLSGVTGLIVSIGITVDSYIVYFERLKDEIKAGGSVAASANRAFGHAFKTVLFADGVSLLGAAILWFFSVGAVKGFAFFLGISTALDVATSWAFTRPFVAALGMSRTFTELPVIGVARGLALQARREAP
jgi:preprotein translocase subunit SecD